MHSRKSVLHNTKLKILNKFEMFKFIKMQVEIMEVQKLVALYMGS